MLLRTHHILAGHAMQPASGRPLRYARRELERINFLGRAAFRMAAAAGALHHRGLQCASPGPGCMPIYATTAALPLLHATMGLVG